MGEVAFFILVTRKCNFPYPWLTCIQDSGLQKLDRAQDGLPPLTRKGQGNTHVNRYWPTDLQKGGSAWVRRCKEG
jgi:hypothetical protein